MEFSKAVEAVGGPTAASTIISATVLMMVILSTHFVTSDELSDMNNTVKTASTGLEVLSGDVKRLNTEVQELNKELPPLKSRVNSLEKDMTSVSEDVKQVSAQGVDLRESYNDIRVRLEEVKGSQNLTNERLKMMIDSR